MKTLTSALALCILTLAAPAFAKDVENLESVTVRSGDLSKEPSVSRGVFREVGGEYALGNGKTLTITREQNHLYAQLSGMRKIALMSAGNLRFTSANNDISIQFTPQPMESLTRVNVSYNPANHY